ncbi:MAG TPA: hypothetical protein VIG94_01830 [Faecalibacter sp.]|uniref:hypothetical protein n=1 Tax=Faecalibacter sp. LW9 TaxID=3103144 RepID=UPI002AFF68B2|nr:hypothetical protein [Faecalibacter sp. LW9]
MTPQIGEVFLMENEQYFIDEQPLHQYFLTLNHPPYFTPPSPTCWRGYYGKWALIGDELYLIHFRGYLEGFDEVDINYLFPLQEQVFADWYSGTIQVPQGKVVQWNDTLNASIYEEYLHLTFENGILIHYECKDSNYGKATETELSH